MFGKKQAPVGIPQESAPKYPALDIIDFRKKLMGAVNTPEWQPKIDPITKKVIETYCNKFLNAACGWFGWTSFAGVLANQIHQMLLTDTTHWKKLDTKMNYASAMEFAAKGCLVIASQPNPSGHGHVNVLVPEPRGIYSNKWGKEVPICANVGGNNFYGKGINWAFATETNLELFVYTGA